MKIRDIVSIIVGSLIIFLLWRMVFFIESYILLLALPCSIIGSYISCILGTNEIPSGVISGIIAGFIVMILYNERMFGIVIMIIFIIGGSLGELIFRIVNKNILLIKI